MALHKRVLLEQFTQQSKDPELRELEAKIDGELRGWRQTKSVAVYFDRKLQPYELAYLRGMYEGKEWFVEIRFPEGQNSTVITLK